MSAYLSIAKRCVVLIQKLERLGDERRRIELDRDDNHKATVEMLKRGVEAGINKSDLAVLAGISRQTVHRLLAEKPPKPS